MDNFCVSSLPILWVSLQISRDLSTFIMEEL